MTQCEIAENTYSGPSQALEIKGERKKAHRADRFCLTGLAWRSYFAGSPPSGCGGKEAASAIPCGTIVDRGAPPGDERWILPEW
jgi:hypothetical protein